MPFFLFTDIEGSTEKWEKNRETMSRVLTRHDAILREEIARFGGRVIKHTGDGIFAVFEGGDVMRCAVEIQKRFQKENWGEVGGLRIRVALHTGYAERRGDDFFGPEINRTARLLAVAWGGQTLVSPPVVKVIKVPPGIVLKDLGTHLLKDLREPQKIFGLLHPDLALREFPPLRSLSAKPQNLPYQSTPFIGREEDIKYIVELLDNPNCRLMTILGPGGSGKTRLALQVAAEKADHYAHGVFYVNLAGAPNAEEMARKAGACFGLGFSSTNPKAELLAALRDKEMLLVLDPLEALTAEGAFLTEILAAAPRVKILAVSRERMGVSGEWIKEIQGLHLPPDGDEAVQLSSDALMLFLDSARRVKPDLQFGPEEQKAAVKICRLVEGLPLGLELAAGWLRSLSVEEVARETEKSLDFLGAGNPSYATGSHGLKESFESSWARLTEDEKKALRRMSVFIGGLTREAAEKALGISLPVLNALVNKSLLKRSPSGRYEMTEINRKFSLDKLGEHPEEKAQAEEGHRAYFTSVFSQPGASLENPELKNDFQNVFAAWQRAVQSRKFEVLGKLLPIVLYYLETGIRKKEGEQLLSQAVTSLRPPGKTPKDLGPERALVFARLLLGLGRFQSSQGLIEQAKGSLKEALGLFRVLQSRADTAQCLLNLSQLSALSGNHLEARAFAEEGLELFRRLGDKQGAGWALIRVGNADMGRDYAKAERSFQESLQLFRGAASKAGILWAMNHLALNARDQGVYANAAKYLEDSLLLAKETGARWAQAWCLNNLGITKQLQGDLKSAAALGAESLDLFLSMDHGWEEGWALDSIGYAKYLAGAEEAPIVVEKALTVLRKTQDQPSTAWCLCHLGQIALSKEDFKAAKSYFQESLDLFTRTGSGMGRVFAESGLAEAIEAGGDKQGYKENVLEALRTARGLKAFPAILEAAVGGARIMIQEKYMAVAVSLLYFASERPEGTWETKRKAKKLLAALEAKHMPAVFAGLLDKAKKENLDGLIDNLVWKKW